MLIQVKKWQTPSEDHLELKIFMTNQIEQSIKFDCSSDYWERQGIQRLTGQQWIDEQIQKCLKDIVYHKKEYTEEVHRTNGRNLWINQLRRSLK